MRGGVAAGCLLACLVLAVSMIPTPAQAAEADGDFQPSFSCTGVTRTVERMICSHALLAQADRELDELYRRATGPGIPDDARQAVRDGQRGWLRQRDQACIAGMTLAQATHDPQPYDCLLRAYGDRIGVLRDRVSPPLQLSMLTAVDVAGMGHPTDFRNGVFSADGRTLAVQVIDGADEAARRVWLYQRDGRLLVPATPVLGRPNANSEAVVSSDVELVWDIDTLYVRSEDEGEDGAGARSFHAATVRDGTSRLLALPPGVDGLFDQQRWYQPSAQDLARLQDDGMLGDGVFALGGYLVWLSDQARGRLLLRMAPRAGVRPPVRELAHGSWELARLVVGRKRLVWPGRDGLMSYEPGRNDARRIAGTMAGDLPVAYDANTRMLAWSSTRPCGSTASGDVADLDPAVPHPWLCVATLSDR